MFNLSGRTALVTGGGRGVGKAVAGKLAEHGATVVINYFHSREQALRTRDELRELGAEVHLVRASVARREQVERMFQQVGELVGGLDVLVNNAASGALAPRAELAERDWSRAFSTNLDGTRWCCELAAPLMAGRGGSIVNLSSIGAGLVVGNYLPVGTSKAAVEALTRYLAVELAPDIRVNAASCGLIDGEVADQFPRAAQMRELTAAATPLGRVATPDDLANVVLFLASDAAGWITGQTILADGGLSLASALLTPAGPADGNAAGQNAGDQNAAGRNSGGQSSADQNSVDQGSGEQNPAAQAIVDGARRSGVPSAADPAGTGEIAAQVSGEDGAGDDPPGDFSGDDFPGGDFPGGDFSGGGFSGGELPDSNLPDSNLPGGGPSDGLPGDCSAEEQDRVVVVVGSGLVVPGAGDPEEFWQLRTSGQVAFSEPGDRWDLDSFYSDDPNAADRTYSRRGGYITPPHRPDDEEYTTCWLRTALRQALDGVGRADADRWSFVVGYTADGSQHLEEALVAAGLRRRMPGAEVDDLVRERLPRGGGDAARFLPHLVGRRAAEGLLPAGTEPLMVDTACSSSLYSVDLGMQDLLAGRCDVAACGGAFALGPRGSTLFSQLQGLSRSDRVRALDADNDGVLFSDGAGVVILKTLRRARQDGDRILGVLPGIGTSSDGRGKAIYAPSAEGQRLAVRRAHQASGITGGEVDWVVAHATGTPAGDLAEFRTLREELASDRPTSVTSNKSQIGHTGWAAGVVSLIEVLQGFRHATLPAQHEFSRPPAEFGVETTNLRIPDGDRRWPAPRTAAVSGFGFGGTNAHLIVRDRPGRPAAVRRRDGELAVVGWSAALPGEPSEEDVAAWLRGTGSGPAAGFGDEFPLPPFHEVRIPPATLRTIDRCQLMALKCINRLPQGITGHMAQFRDTTGVVVGHMGPTRTATLYALRCYLGMLENAVQSSDELRSRFADFERTVRSLVPAGNENSFPGIMPNIVPARVANYFDLHGPNIAVDTGTSSGLTAVRVAGRYLRSGGMDLALACGINGNSTPELRDVLGPALGADTELGEGAFLVALAREPHAREHGLPVLGLISEEEAGVSPEVAPESTRRTYLAGDGSKALVEALVRPDPVATVRCADPLSGEDSRLVVRKAVREGAGRAAAEPAAGQNASEDGAGASGQLPEPRSAPQPDAWIDGPGQARVRRDAGRTAPEPVGQPAPDAAGRGSPAPSGPPEPNAAAVPTCDEQAASEDEPSSRSAESDEVRMPPVAPLRSTPATDPAPALPDQPTAEDQPAAQDQPTAQDQPAAQDRVEQLVHRHVVQLQDRPHVPVREVGPVITRETVVLTDRAELARPLADAGAAVVCTEAGTGWHVPDEITPDGMRAVLDPLLDRARHLHVVADLHGSPLSGTLVLHDALFLALQALHRQLTTFTGLLLNGMLDGAPHQQVGLFTGLAKSTALELDEVTCRTVVTSSGSLDTGLAQLAGELAATDLTVAVHDGARRRAATAFAEPETTGEPLPFDSSSVVVGAGGARGITAEALVALAAETAATIWVLGTNPLDDYPESVFQVSDEEFTRSRATFISDGLRAEPGVSVAELNRRFERRAQARESRANLDRMAARGSAVHYLTCDLGDPDDVERAVRTIHEQHGSIDLLIHGAGLNRGAALANKDFAEFRRVRDTKVRGYAHLDRALADRPPRTWCNFGSLVGFTGQDGELDYAAANDFLATAAARAARTGRDEFTVGWTLWRRVGLGANPITQSFMQRSGLYTGMSTEEGRAHFLDELRGRHQPSVVHLGETERAAIARRAPALLPAENAEPSSPDGSSIPGGPPNPGTPSNLGGLPKSGGSPSGDGASSRGGAPNPDGLSGSAGSSAPATSEAHSSGPASSGTRSSGSGSSRGSGTAGSGLNSSGAGSSSSSAPTGPVPASSGPTSSVSAASEPDSSGPASSVPASSVAAGSGPPGFFLGRVLERAPDRIVVERELSLDVDGYLEQHQVNGVPTLPGTLVPEIAAEAALALEPDRRVAALSDLVLEAFLRVHPARPGMVFRVVAERGAEDSGQVPVSVRVLSDLRAPQGTLLKKDRLHFSVTVHMQRSLSRGPAVFPWPEDPDELPVVDPYHVANPAVHLTGTWVSTADTRVHASGNRAVFAPNQLPAAFAGFRVPAVLMDGLARTAVLTPARFAPLAAPLSIGRIEFFDPRNDVELARDLPRGVELRAEPAGIGVADPGAANQLIALGPGGGMLLRMSGLRGKVLGHVDTVNGGFRSPGQQEPSGSGVRS